MHVKKKKKVPRKTDANKKSIMYHKILDTILSSLRDVQREGLIWNLKYPDGKYYEVRFVFPISMCVVDMKGGKQLCGMYDSYHGISRPCISCLCKPEDLGNMSKICSPVIDEEIKEVIISGDKKKLQILSQHDNPFNAFFSLDTGGWKYGIWGLCPTEVLHQFYEGVVDYALNEFYHEVLTDKYRDHLIVGCEEILIACKNQSDRDFPSGNFTLGITKTGKIKGIEKFASLFYVALFLHTSKAHTKYFDGGKIMLTEQQIVQFKEWRELFEDMLYYHDWLMQKEFRRSTLALYQKKINNLNKKMQKLIHRKGIGIKFVPKFHEFCHISRDILRFGSPLGTSTEANEGFLGKDKDEAIHTQRWVRNFTQQTSQRHFESDVINYSYKNLHHLIYKKTAYRSKTSDMKNNDMNEENITMRGKLEIVLNVKEGNEVEMFYPDSKSKKMIQVSNENDFNTDLKEFFLKSIFGLIDTSSAVSLQCFTTMVRSGLSFRGCSRDSTNEHSGWAMFQWVDEDSGDIYQVPGKIILFIDFSTAKFLPRYSEYYPTDELHVIIQSLQSCPQENTHQNHSSVCSKCTLEKKNEYHCLSIRTLYNSSFVIPDFGNADKHKFLYVYPRQYNQDDNNEEGGWSNKL